jgi:FMN phosphatase YigB (HAD superfamily)
MPLPRVVFFDLGDTLVVPRLDAGGSLTALEPFPFVPQILAKMKLEARLGVISNTPQGTTVPSISELLSVAGILGHFDSHLLLFSSVEGMDKTQKAFFARAAARATTPVQHCLFVGESDAERGVAKAAGMNTAFHALHAFEVLKRISAQ